MTDAQIKDLVKRLLTLNYLTMHLLACRIVLIYSETNTFFNF